MKLSKTLLGGLIGLGVLAVFPATAHATQFTCDGQGNASVSVTSHWPTNRGPIELVLQVPKNGQEHRVFLNRDETFTFLLPVGFVGNVFDYWNTADTGIAKGITQFINCPAPVESTTTTTVAPTTTTTVAPTTTTVVDVPTTTVPVVTTTQQATTTTTQVSVVSFPPDLDLTQELPATGSSTSAIIALACLFTLLGVSFLLLG
jgi:hypothetical protein